jgi:hypothetical protein
LAGVDIILEYGATLFWRTYNPDRGSRMKCPHCNTGIHEHFTTFEVVLEGPVEGFGGQVLAPGLKWKLFHQRCPECHDSIILLDRSRVGTGVWSGWRDLTFMAYPSSRRRRIAPEVPDPYRQDFLEAFAVLADSAKASAALSRRCLQAILKDHLGATKKDLYDQIEEVLAPGKLPSHIDDGLHAIRNIGNIAAHSMKSTTTGTIVDVAPGEAEWNLEVIEMLFDFCFVQPANAAKRKADLNEKLKDLNKPPIP